MPQLWDSVELDERIRTAVRDYWLGRSSQATKQKAEGKQDQGTRAEVTGGKHLDSVLWLLAETARRAGFGDGEVLFNKGVTLPGYYRPTKKWDLVVARGNRLCAAVEIKSQVGSFGNNVNNRTEEALGNSRDFWVAHREGGFGKYSPWLGYFFFLEDSERSTRSVKLPKSRVFDALPIFLGSSYYRRYEILCDRMVQERDYNEACLMISPRGSSGGFRSPSDERGPHQFIKSFGGHLLGCL